MMAALWTRIWAFTSVAALVAGQECNPTTGVCDKHERCSVWKEEGECLRNRQYMQKHCPASCSVDSAGGADANASAAEACTDRHERCKVWAALGECEANARDMSKFCAKSCKACGSSDDDEEEDEEEGYECKDLERRCSAWAKSGECDKNPNYMHMHCAKSCNACEQQSTTTSSSSRGATSDEDLASSAGSLVERSVAFGERQLAEGKDRLKILRRLEETLTYFDSKEVNELPTHIRRECKNRHELCTFWNVIGECEANKAYMTTNCAAACHTCYLIDLNERCPPLKDAVPALLPGSLNQMFERIVSTAPGNRTDLSDEELKELEATKTPLYTVQVLSRPKDEPLTEVSVVQDKSLPPWVITFDNFITEEECEAMIQLGYKYKYKRSEDVGARKFDGSFDSRKSEGRTSENAWCSTREGCRAEEVPKRLHERMSRVMDIPAVNSEDLQLLKYEKGQFYRTHHDYIPHQKDRQTGPRILTFFLYLSDVEAGGGTNFPNLDLTVMPKRGRALLWPSVLDSDPSSKDGRLNHQALPVEGGVKFAANGWIHLHDYVGPQERGCN